MVQRYLLVFFLVLVTGDATMMVLSSLHYLPFPVLLIVCTAANFTSDVVLSLFGGFLLERITHPRFLAYRAKTEALLTSVKKPAVFVFLSKVIYGTRVLAVILIPNCKLMSRPKFFLYDVAAVALINAAVLSISWVYGTAMARVINEHVLYGAAALALLILITRTGGQWISRWISQSLARSYPPSKRKTE